MVKGKRYFLEIIYIIVAGEIVSIAVNSKID